VKQYRICEYKNGNGEGYCKVEYKSWLGWCELKEWDFESGMHFPMHFNNKKQAESWLKKYANSDYKKVSCDEYNF